MDKNRIKSKFGNDYYVNEMTYKLGIDVRFSEHLASRFKGLTVLETCAGGGFTSISLTRYANHVYSFEIDGNRMKEAVENAKIAGADHKITFTNADVMQILDAGISHKIDAAFLDPDWADLEENSKNHMYKFIDSSTRPPSDLLLGKALEITPDVTLIQPPLVDEIEFKHLPEHELELLYLDGSHELYALHFGSIAEEIGRTEFRA